jgi:hypothetical protein
VIAFWLIIVMQNVDGDLQMLWLWEGIYWSRLIANAGLIFLDLEDNLDEVTSEDDNFSGTIHLTGRCCYEAIIHVFGTWKNSQES